MEYKIYKLTFPNGVHFGKNSLESTQYVFQADTFFSSLCIEAIHRGEESLERLLAYVKQDKLAFSDALPYIGKEYYIPKPMLHIENNNQGDSVIKKAFKKMAFVPFSCFEEYLRGELSKEKAEGLGKLGYSQTKVSAFVRGEDETMPYRVGIYYYREDCGLYLIVRYGEETVQEFFEELLDGLAFSGIGGKRNTGLGRFDFFRYEVPVKMRERLEKTEGCLMTLSVSLPTEEELEAVLHEASYLLEKRSGFVASESYAKEQMRKKDLFVFQSGSCFNKSFRGGVYDVSAGGRHAVYRYAKPLFMEVT